MRLTKSLSSLGLKLELVLVAGAKTVHRANLYQPLSFPPNFVTVCAKNYYMNSDKVYFCGFCEVLCKTMRKPGVD